MMKFCHLAVIATKGGSTTMLRFYLLYRLGYLIYGAPTLVWVSHFSIILIWTGKAFLWPSLTSNAHYIGDFASHTHVFCLKKRH